MPKLDQKYLMESDEEYLRLDMKTNEQAVEKQAGWAGIQAGMRVADLGCGSGKTSAVLRRLVQPGGSVIGIDFAENRIRLAEEHYAGDGLQFQCRDIRQPLDDLGSFDFIWVRFVLEYYLAEGFAIVKNIEKMLRPGGILCLVDLDHNCLSHYGLSDRLNRTLQALLLELQNKANFDPYAGRKLYSFLYDLNYLDIRVEVAGHHVIYGDLKEADAFNWLKKVEVAPGRIGYEFKEYAGGYPEFHDEFKNFFSDPRRFTYSPIITCRGKKP